MHKRGLARRSSHVICWPKSCKMHSSQSNSDRPVSGSSAAHQLTRKRQDEDYGPLPEDTCNKTEPKPALRVRPRDVIHSGTVENETSVHAGNNQDARISLPAEKFSDRRLYVQHGRHFKAVDQSTEGSSDTVKRHVSLFSQLATHCQGVLTGITLWQQLAVPASGHLDKVYDALVYLLTATCIIYALDNIHCWRRVASILVYVALLLLHLSTSRWSHWQMAPWLDTGYCISAVTGWALGATS